MSFTSPRRCRTLRFLPLEDRTTPDAGDLLRPDPNPNPIADDRFGHAVAVDAQHVVVGAPYADVGGIPDAGAVYVFDRATGALVATVPNPEPAPGDRYGWSVVLWAGGGWVGAPYDDPGGVAENVRRCVATGVAGLSIEDGTGRRATPLYEIEVAAARVRAARKAIDESGEDVVLTGRAEGFLVGDSDLDGVIRRLRAYAEAGADCLFAPGITTREQIAAVVAAVAPKPVNVLVLPSARLSVEDFAALGVSRLSTGSGLARAAWGGFIRAAREIATAGRFDALDEATPHAELDRFFREDLKRRPDRSR